MNRPARRELIATVDREELGRLCEEAGIWSFEYLPAWTQNPDSFDLSPHLPRTAGRIVDGSTARPVQWFFDNLLPEEDERELLARTAAVPSADAFGLLSYYGKESAGALTLSVPGEPAAEAGLRRLTNAELHERISQLPAQPLAARAPKHMSLAGAQHKLAVCVRDAELFEPVGATPSTHILKPNHTRTEHYPDSVVNEYFVMSLAARMGLEVPPVEIRFVPDPIYLIERFDRATIDGETRRLHCIDACQLLNLDRTFKYQQSSVDTLVRCLDYCTNVARSRRRLLQWVLFNVLIGNADAHLKNLSFRTAAHGIELAPFYDLLSTECYRAQIGNRPRWPQRELSLRIGTAQTFAALTRDDFLAFATALGTTRRAAIRLLDELSGNLHRRADELYQELEAMQVPTPLMRASQLRTLDKIRHIVIRDMLDRMQGPSGTRATPSTSK